ncbi:MAG: DUF721 domain-containing protein [Rickettsiales bacterium]|nr:DUF721 domain-containing protein [Rickettsiales bacterium]
MREDWLENKRKNYENDLSSIISELIKPHLKGKNKLEAVFITSWAKIFGEEIAKKISLTKISIGKNNKNILYLSVQPSFMLEASHMKDTLLERIKTYFGYQAIDEIIFRKNLN